MVNRLSGRRSTHKAGGIQPPHATKQVKAAHAGRGADHDIAASQVSAGQRRWRVTKIKTKHRCAARKCVHRNRIVKFLADKPD